MKFVLATLFGLLLGSLAVAQPPKQPAAPHHHVKPNRPTPPPNWNNQHHRRPVGVRPVAPIHRPRVFVNNYHINNGLRFRFGFYYNGFNHNHWSYHYWDTRYGTYLYYDPYALQYYYWCAPHFRFYPITYAPVGYAFPYVANPVPPPVPPPTPPPAPPPMAPANP